MRRTVHFAFFTFFLLLSVTASSAEDVTPSEGVSPAPTTSSLVSNVSADSEQQPRGHIIAQDVTGEVIPPAMRAISKASSAEPSLGLHGITEQQLNLRYYNFICSSHFHLDCKITETLQICMKDRYVAVLGLPLAFDADSSDLTTLAKWMRQCDQNDQDVNQDAMRIIRKRIHFQNEHNWEGVFGAANRHVSIAIVTVLIALLGF